MAQWNVINLSSLENYKDFSAEYYKREYIQKSATIRRIGTIRSAKTSFITDGEHGSPCWSDTSGIKYITAEFIKENYIEQADYKEITEEQDKRNARARLQKNDILIYSVGAYAGLAAVAEPHLFPANIPRSVAIMRLNKQSKLNAEYVCVFINSKYGKFQSLRLRAGNSQPVLALDKIRQFEIPLLREEIQNEIQDLYQKSYNARILSQSLYRQAEELLSKELKLDQLNLDSPKCYTSSFSDIVNNSRFDGEFYQPKYQIIEDYIKDYPLGYSKISQHFSECTESFIPCKETYKYIEIGDVNIGNGSVVFNEIKTNELPASAKIRLRKDFLLVSTVRPYRGAVAIIDYDYDDLVGSSAFTVMCEKGTYKKEVLQLLLRLNCYKTLLMKYNVGTSYPVIKNSDVMNVVIPLIDQDVQNKIATLIQKSKKSLQQSKTLLAQAKARVEELIEQEAQNS